MSIHYVIRGAVLTCAALAAASSSQAVAQSPYQVYGAPPFGFGGGIVANPHPADLYNGSTIGTPGTFRDRFRQPDNAGGSSPCGPPNAGFGSSGLADRQSSQLGMFHDRFAEFRRPDSSNAGGGPDQKANTGIPFSCR